MRKVVGDLLMLVSGKNARMEDISSSHTSYTSHAPHAAMRPKAIAHSTASRSAPMPSRPKAPQLSHGAASSAPAKADVKKPNEVIPLDDDDFSDF